MITGRERGLAQKLLALKGKGSPVPNDLAASARRVLDGQERPGDMDAIRRYFNVGRSHAGQLRGGLGLGQRVAGTAMNLSRDYEMLTQGSAAAGARMVATVGLDLSQELVKNRRALIKVGEGVAESVGADPALAARFFNSLSRIAKVGGVVGTAIVAGFSAAHNYFETLRAGSEAGQRMNQAFFDFGNRYMAEHLQARARGQLERETLRAGTGNTTLDKFFNIDVLDEYLRSRQETATSERMEQMMAHARKSRELVRPSSGPALIKYASEKGKAISDLTPEEINTVLDAEANKQIDFTMDEYFSYTQEKQKQLVWWERMLMDVSPQYWNATQHEWSRELYDRAQKRYAVHMEAVAHAEQDVLRRMSATDRLQLLQTRQEATANFAAYRSRHKAVLLD